MANKDGNRYESRMSEEFQLLAEEKWIINALNKLKHQRNCLQIERLHLESIKASIMTTFNRGMPPSSQLHLHQKPVFSASAVNLMQNSNVKSSELEGSFEKRLDDETCNEEELNLCVTNSVFNQYHSTDVDMEEDDEEDDADMYMIDMNMLMHGGRD